MDHLGTRRCDEREDREREHSSVFHDDGFAGIVASRDSSGRGEMANSSDSTRERAYTIEAAGDEKVIGKCRGGSDRLEEVRSRASVFEGSRITGEREAFDILPTLHGDKGKGLYARQ